MSFNIPEETSGTGLYFHEDPAETTIEIWVEDVAVPGVYRAEERGAGIHEEYKAEVESRSGGEDTASEPDAAEIEVEAWITPDTYSALNRLRERQTPFGVQIGPFAYERMGVANIEATTLGEYPDVMELSMTLREYREVIVQERNLIDGDGGGDGGGGGGGSTGDLDAEGPAAEWIDEDGDGYDDETGEELPEMQTVPLPSGQQWVQNIGSGSGWGRVILDASGGGAEPVVNTDGTNWAVQDIGVRGKLPSQKSTTFNLTERGGSSLVQNIYLGDGAAHGRQTGMWYDADSTGHVIVRFVNVQGMGDNGLYFSGPKGKATVLFDRCYSANNGISNYRTGKGEIRNCVGYNDGGGNGAHGGRVIWGRTPGPVEVIDSNMAATVGDVVWSGAHDGGSVVNIGASSEASGSVQQRNGGVVNGSTNGNPNLAAPSGNIPGSPEDAASGLE